MKCESSVILTLNENIDEEWDWDRVVETEFKKDKELFIEEEYRKYMAAYKIQQWWKGITMSPHTEIGSRFINKKYDKLFNE